MNRMGLRQGTSTGGISAVRNGLKSLWGRRLEKTAITMAAMRSIRMTISH
jgi:hypothetical protein